MVEKLIWQETFDTRHVYYDPFRLPRSQRMGFAVLHVPILVCVLMVLLSVMRIASTYPLISQAFDEPCHVAAGLEFLDRGTYRLDPIHPPLSRIAIGLPLYLAGKRFPMFPTEDVAPKTTT